MATPSPDVANLVSVLQAMMQGSDPAARRQAEDNYAGAKKSNPDTLLSALIQVVSNQIPGIEESTREFAIVLMRRLFQPDAAEGGEICFNKCQDGVKQGVVDSLLKQWAGGEKGESLTSVKIHKCVGNALVALADNVILPVVDGGERREEEKWQDLLRATMVISAGNAFGSGVQETTGMVKIRTNGLKILCELLSIYPETIKALQKDIQGLLEGCFMHSDVTVNVEGVELVLHMVMSMKAKEWKALQPCLSVILRCVEKLAEARPEFNDLLRQVLETMTEVAEYEGLAIFFKPEIQNLTELISKIVAAKKELEEDVRTSALEFLISLAEQKPKMVSAQYAQFPAVLLKCTMDCLLEVNHNEEDWVELMEDEEEDDEDELYKLGCEVIDRAIMAFQMKKFSASYFEAIGYYINKGNDAQSGDTEPWRYTLAGLSAVSEGVEYVEEDNEIDSLMTLCLEKTQHPHTRVRAQAWHALSRIFLDHGSATQRWHQQYMDATMKALENDPVMRVQQKCLGAFLYFGEALDGVVMEEYSQVLLVKLVNKLQQRGLHRGVREESITAIAVIAGSIGVEFGKYYSDIMPFLKEILTTSTVEKETRLRGKAFECMSLLGVAVGKEKFKVDGSQCLHAMLEQRQTSSVAGANQQNGEVVLEKKNAEVLNDYLKDAVERIAGVLDEDLGPFLQPLLDTFLRPLDLDNLPSAGNNDDDDDLEVIELEGGKRVKSAVFKEMKDACDVITTLLQNCKASFFAGNHIERVCKIMLSILKCEDERIRMHLESDEVMEGASDSWAACIGILARKNQKTCQDYLVEYCKTQVQYLSKDKIEDDPEVLSTVAKGIADVLSSACPVSTATAQERDQFGDTTRYLDASTLQQLWRLVLGKMEQCIKRREEILLKGVEYTAEEEDVEGEVGNLETSDDHHEANISLSQIIGSLMMLNPGFFKENFLQEMQQMVMFLLDVSKISPAIAAKDKKVITDKNKILAYFLTCDLAEFLKTEASVVFMNERFLQYLFQDLEHKNCEIRHAASYCVFLMSSLDGFRDNLNLAGKAFQILLKVIKGGKKEFGKSVQNRYISSEEIAMADDNLSAASFQLLACSPTISAQVSNEDWNLILSRLPLKSDSDMNLQVIQKLIQITQVDQRQDVLGANKERVGKICAVLAEAYKSFATNAEEKNKAVDSNGLRMEESSENLGNVLDGQIVSLFRQLPQSIIEGDLKQQFSKTQWKKLEKIVKDSGDAPTIVN